MEFPAVLHIDKLHKAQSEANDLLKGAMMDERSQSWNKVSNNYNLPRFLVS